MAVLPIVKGADNPVLRRKTDRVPQVTKEVKKLVKDMRDTLEKEETGAGLAAPQVGAGLRVCIATIGGKQTVLINPDITWKSEERDVEEEGCLSLPGLWLPVPRHREIVLSYMDENGKTQERRLRDFDARVVQHEADHLDGVLIVDYGAVSAPVILRAGGTADVA